MASRKKKAQKWKEKVEYKRRLRDKHTQRRPDKTHLAGIAAVYQEQEKSNPEIALSTFSARCGVQPEQLRRFMRHPITENKINTLSVTQFAGHYGISTNVVEQWIRVGALKANSVEGEWRIPDTPEIIPKKKFEDVILWHGTTEHRAKCIIEGGFKMEGNRRNVKIWFTTYQGYALRNTCTPRLRDRFQTIFGIRDRWCPLRTSHSDWR